jgi:hypothetical protein
MSALLPAEFADLEPFAADWCLATEHERFTHRVNSDIADIEAFYNAIVPRTEAALEYLERLPFHSLPDDATNLLHLLYSMTQASFPVEVWHQPRVPDSGSATFDCFKEPVP